LACTTRSSESIQHHAVAHVGEDALALVALALQRLEADAQQGGQRVDRASEPPRSSSAGCSRTHPRLPGAEPDRHPLQLAHPARLGAGHAVGDQHRQQQPEGGREQRLEKQRGVERLDARQGLREPEQGQVAAARQRHREVDELAPDGAAPARGTAHLAGQRRLHLRPPGVVLDRAESLVGDLRVAAHPARPVDERDAASQRVPQGIGQLRGAIAGRGQLAADRHHSLPGVALQALLLQRDQPPVLLVGGHQHHGRECHHDHDRVGEHQAPAQRHGHGETPGLGRDHGTGAAE
jgi:hypothetical protein